MLSLDVALLKTNNLSHLIQTNWYAKELAMWQAAVAQFDIVSYKEANQLNWTKSVRKVENLLEDQAYIEAAVCLQIGCGGEKTPLIAAIQLNDINLVMACLALGHKVYERVWGETLYPLTEAMIGNNLDIFNLLLLVPGINVNVEAEVKGEFDDISQFLGMGEQFDYYRPVETLMSSAYAPILASLNIDTEKRYGAERVPLMVHAYRTNNIGLMNWLVFCGAEINPFLDGYSDAGPNLINLALYDYLSYKNDRHTRLLKWFSRFGKLLTGCSELSSSLLQDLIESAESGAPELIDWFDLQSIIKTKQDSEEELNTLTAYYKELQAELNIEKQKMISLARAVSLNQHVSPETMLRVSLLVELQRVHQVVVGDYLQDIFVEVNESGVAFGMVYQGDLIYVEVQSSDVQFNEELVNAKELLTYSTFQLMLYFLSLSERFWFKLSLLAEQQDVYPFKSIAGNYLVTQRFAELFLDQSVKGDFDHLDLCEWRVLHKSLSTLATEVDLLNGTIELAQIVEDVCSHKVFIAQNNQHYFNGLENRTIKTAERRVFENLKPIFEHLTLIVFDTCQMQ